MLLLGLLILVFLVTVFLLGSYYVQLNANAASCVPNPTKQELELNHAACPGPTSSGTATPSGTSGSTSSEAAEATELPKRRCKKHRKYRCSHCKVDDGFSTNGVFGSSPAPF